MDNLQYFQRTQVNIQPVLHLVDLFEESTEYERFFRLPFNALILCVEEDPEDPSWVDLSEKKIRYLYQKGKVYFGTCETPMKIRFTRKNPDQYKSIRVRVSGFSATFVNLADSLQENVIARTVNSL